MHPPPADFRSQRGVLLLEVLIAILIFSFGILGIVGLQASTLKNAADAKYRADAGYLANQLIGTMWTDTANLAQYQHRPSGSACSYSGTASSYAAMTTWLSRVSSLLPSAAETNQQVVVDTVTNSGTTSNRITIRVCWKLPSETTWHNFMTVAYVN